MTETIENAALFRCVVSGRVTARSGTAVWQAKRISLGWCAFAGAAVLSLAASRMILATLAGVTIGSRTLSRRSDVEQAGLRSGCPRSRHSI